MIDETKLSAAWKDAKTDLQCCQYLPFRFGFIAGVNSVQQNPVSVLYAQMKKYVTDLEKSDRAYTEGYINAARHIQNKEYYTMLINTFKNAIESIEVCTQPKTDV